MNYQDFPKVELHLHLDCSLSYGVVQELDPSISHREYQKKFVAPNKCRDLADYIRRAESGCALMQTRDQLLKVTTDLLDQLKADKVMYSEIRFAPLLHTKRGLTPTEVVHTVLSVLNESYKSYGIHTGLILCTLRHFSEQESLTTAGLVQEYHGRGVVALDLAADEANFPITNHIKAFQLVKKLGIPATAHAGEALGAESIVETLNKLKPTRLGHGVRCIENAELVDQLIDQDIHLEICPTSNIQVNVFDSLKNHPVDILMKRGVSLSINTDGRAVSGINLTEEYHKIQTAFGWSVEHFKKCNLEAIRHAFAPQEIKNKLNEFLIREYENY